VGGFVQGTFPRAAETVKIGVRGQIGLGL